jgi:hypothetical protein
MKRRTLQWHLLLVLSVLVSSPGSTTAQKGLASTPLKALLARADEVVGTGHAISSMPPCENWTIGKARSEEYGYANPSSSACSARSFPASALRARDVKARKRSMCSSFRPGISTPNAADPARLPEEMPEITHADQVNLVDAEAGRLLRHGRSGPAC